MFSLKADKCLYDESVDVNCIYTFDCFQVQKIEIAYSKTAKKIDVKKVKKAMWDIVMSSTSLEDKVHTRIYWCNIFSSL